MDKKLDKEKMIYLICNEYLYYYNILRCVLCIKENYPRIKNYNFEEFFSALIISWVESIVLYINRVLDPVSSGRKGYEQENFVLKRLVVVEEGECDKKISFAHDFVVEKDLRSYRNKILAHADLKKILKNDYKIYKELKIKEIIKSMKLIKRAINCLIIENCIKDYKCWVDDVPICYSLINFLSCEYTKKVFEEEFMRGRC